MDLVAENAGPKSVAQVLLAREGAVCPNPQCGAALLQVGFIAETVERQAYLPQAGKLVKGQKSKSAVQIASCLLCSTTVEVVVN